MDPPSASNQQVAEALEEVAVFKRILSLCCVQRLKHSLQAGAWKELGIGERLRTPWVHLCARLTFTSDDATLSLDILSCAVGSAGSSP